MLGTTHAASGGAVGLAVGLAAPSPWLGLGCGVVGWVAAWLPDLDHSGSRASRCLGPISWLVCRGVRGLSAALGLPKHRGGSHTVAAALLCGLLVAGIVAVWAPRLSLLAGGATAAGYLAALAGDWLTVSSLPFLWWPWRLETPGPPRGLRLQTGGVVELWVVQPLMFAACAGGVALTLGVLR